jgi:transposase
LHLLTDGSGLPLAVAALPGQAHESTQFETVVDSVHIRRWRGRPRQRPRSVGGDRAYHARRIRQWLRRHGIGAVIPPKRSRGRRRRGRLVTYNAVRYRGRSIIECGIGWLKECRSVATRYEKLALHYLGLVKLAMIERYLRRLSTLQTSGAT